jgi:hypothetical protein
MQKEVYDDHLMIVVDNVIEYITVIKTDGTPEWRKLIDDDEGSYFILNNEKYYYLIWNEE